MLVELLVASLLVMSLLLGVMEAADMTLKVTGRLQAQKRTAGGFTSLMESVASGSVHEGITGDAGWRAEVEGEAFGALSRLFVRVYHDDSPGSPYLACELWRIPGRP